MVLKFRSDFLIRLVFLILLILLATYGNWFFQGGLKIGISTNLSFASDEENPNRSNLRQNGDNDYQSEAQSILPTSSLSSSSLSSSSSTSTSLMAPANNIDSLCRLLGHNLQKYFKNSQINEANLTQVYQLLILPLKKAIVEKIITSTRDPLLKKNMLDSDYKLYLAVTENYVRVKKQIEENELAKLKKSIDQSSKQWMYQPILTVNETISSKKKYLEFNLEYLKYKGVLRNKSGSESKGSATSGNSNHTEEESISEQISNYQEMEKNNPKWKSVSVFTSANPKENTISINEPFYIDPATNKEHRFSWHEKEPNSPKHSDLSAVLKYLLLEKEMVVKVLDDEFYEKKSWPRNVKAPLIIFREVADSKKLNKIHYGKRVIKTIVIRANVTMAEIWAERRKLAENKILSILKNGISVKSATNIKDILNNLETPLEAKKMLQENAANSLEENILLLAIKNFRENGTASANILKSSLDIIETLVNMGADLSKIGIEEMSPASRPGPSLLYQASAEGKENTVSAILKHPEIDKNNSRYNSLLYANYINKIYSNGYTALMAAVINQRAAVIKLLLSAGADLSIKNAMGENCLSLAFIHKAEKSARILLDHMKNNESVSSSTKLSSRSSNLDSKQTAITSSNWKSVTEEGNLEGSYPIHKIITDNYKSSNLENFPTKSAELLASIFESYPHFNFNSQEKKSGNTLLNLAARGGEVRVVEMLLKRADDLHLQVSLENKSGKDALISAKEEMVNYLSCGERVTCKWKAIIEMIQEYYKNHPEEFANHLLLDLKLSINSNDPSKVENALQAITNFKKQLKNGEEVLNSCLSKKYIKWDDYLINLLDNWPLITNFNNYSRIVYKLLLSKMKWNEEVLEHIHINAHLGNLTFFEQLINSQNLEEKYISDLFLVIIKQVRDWPHQSARASFLNGTNDIKNHRQEFSYRYTPLNRALLKLNASSSINVMRILLEEKEVEVDKGIGLKYGNAKINELELSSPLYRAVDMLDLQKANLLLKYKADCTLAAYPGGKSPLEHAESMSMVKISNNPSNEVKINQAKLVAQAMRTHLISSGKINKYTEIFAERLATQLKLRSIINNCDQSPSKLLEAFNEIDKRLLQDGIKKDGPEYYRFMNGLMSLPAVSNATGAGTSSMLTAYVSTSSSTSANSQSSKGPISVLGQLIISQWKKIKTVSNDASNSKGKEASNHKLMLGTFLQNIANQNRGTGYSTTINLSILRDNLESAIRNKDLINFQNLIKNDFIKLNDNEKSLILNGKLGDSEYGSSLLIVASQVWLNIKKGGIDTSEKDLRSIITLLFSVGADFDERAQMFGNTNSRGNSDLLLSEAAFRNDIKLVDAVINAIKKAYPRTSEKNIKKQQDFFNAVDSNGWTILNSAIWSGNVEVTKKLILAGADVNRPNTNSSWSFSPLMTAAYKGHLEIASYLLENENIHGKINLNHECKINGTGRMLNALGAALKVSKEGNKKAQAVGWLIKQYMVKNNFNFFTTTYVPKYFNKLKEVILKARKETQEDNCNILINMARQTLADIKKVVYGENNSGVSISERSSGHEQDKLHERYFEIMQMIWKKVDYFIPEKINALSNESSKINIQESKNNNGNKNTTPKGDAYKSTLFEILMAEWPLSKEAVGEDSKTSQTLQKLMVIFFNEGEAPFTDKLIGMKTKNSGYTLLNISCLQNNTQMVKAIINALKRTYHLESDRSKIIKYINEKNSDGKFPLYFAAYNNNLEVLKILLAEGAAVNEVTEDNLSYNSLMIAVERGHFEIVKYLIENIYLNGLFNLETGSKTVKKGSVLRALEVAEKLASESTDKDAKENYQKIAILIGKHKLKQDLAEISFSSSDSSVSSSSSSSSSSSLSANLALNPTFVGREIAEIIINMELDDKLDSGKVESKLAALKSYYTVLRAEQNAESSSAGEVAISTGGAAISNKPDFSQEYAQFLKSLINDHLMELALKTWAKVAKNEESKASKELRQIITLFLDHGGILNRQRYSIRSLALNRTLLHEAVVRNDVNLVRAIIRDLESQRSHFSKFVWGKNFNLQNQLAAQKSLILSTQILKLKKMMELRDYLDATDSSNHHALMDVTTSTHQEIKELLTDFKNSLKLASPKVKSSFKAKTAAYPKQVSLLKNIDAVVLPNILNINNDPQLLLTQLAFIHAYLNE